MKFWVDLLVSKTFLWLLPKLFCLWLGALVISPVGQFDCNGLINYHKE